MKKEECFYLGKITKPFGYKGELVFYLDVDEPAKYAKLDMVFVEIKQQLIPFFIENIRLKDYNATVKLKDIPTEEALQMINNNLYLPLSMLPPLKGNQFYYHEITEYKVIDNNRGDIGFVETVLEYPHQAILQIKFEDKEILLPIVDKIIHKLDREKQELYVIAPEGLIDFYLQM